MLKEGVDYKFINIEDSDLSAVQILHGSFSGVIYHYNSVKVIEEGEFARLSFGYSILDSGKHDEVYLINNEKFDMLMGDILTEMILKEEVYEQTRAFDTEEFDI